MAMQDKEFDALFSSKLNDFEVTPSVQVWGNINTELDKGRRKKSLFPLLGIAASIMVLISAGLLFIPKGMPAKHPAQNNVARLKTPVKNIPQVKIIITPVALPVNTIAKQHLTIVAVRQAVHIQNIKKQTPSVKQPVPSKTEEQPVLSASAQQTPIVAVVPDVSTPLTIIPQEITGPVTAKPVIADVQPAVNTKTNVTAKPRHRIHTLGDIINLAVAKVDKRRDKIIEFTNTDDDDEANVSAVNLGVVRIKKEK
jgi:hypothetical protein